VLRSQAESLLLRGLPENAAKIFARSDADFDMVILRILNLVPQLSSFSIGGVGGSGNEFSDSSRKASSSSSSSSSSALLQYLLEQLGRLELSSRSGGVRSMASQGTIQVPCCIQI
jgi:hypothetical protein